MGIDHRGTHILVSKQLLNRADVVSIFEQMGRETVPECVAVYWLVDSRQIHGFFNRPLQTTLMDVMPSCFTCPRIIRGEF